MTALPHDKALEELEIVALGAASPEATAGMLAHAAECTDCRRELDEYTLLMAALTALMPEQDLNRGRSAGIRSRLLARADADMEAAGKREVAAAALQKQKRAQVARKPALAPDQAVRAMTESPRREEPPAETKKVLDSPRAALGSFLGSDERPAHFGLLLWASIATVALLTAIGAFLLRPAEDNGEVEAALAREAEAESRADSLELLLRQRERTVGEFVAPQVRIIDLTNFGSQGRPVARLFWNPETRRYSLFAYELRPVRPAHTYQLWVTTTQGRRSIGTFQTRADGTGEAESAIELNPATVRTVFVTEEVAPGASQPNGRVLAAGAP
ncbi:MAG TPA: anti-sigma factor [Gemmatimonadaceae bacterium]|nr:anti-sigma factor [Gemmatimonadaceae bacterium]